MRHALAQLLASGEIHDPALQGVVLTVTEVRMSPDLKSATVFFTPLGGEGGPALLKALKRAGPFIRARLSKAVNLKFSPELWFELDRSFDAASRIDQVLRTPQVRRDLD
jgi:ribosome-binding factor A